MKVIFLERKNLAAPFTIWERKPQEDQPDDTSPNVIIDEGQGSIILSQFVLIDQGQGSIDLGDYSTITEEF